MPFRSLTRLKALVLNALGLHRAPDAHNRKENLIRLPLVTLPHLTVTGPSDETRRPLRACRRKVKGQRDKSLKARSNRRKAKRRAGR